MKTSRNEQGYTLLIVLLTITIMLPLATMLINRNVNSARQIQVTEEYYSSIALAEMGITRIGAEVEHQLELNMDHILETMEPDNEAWQANEINQSIASFIVSKISVQEQVIYLDDRQFFETKISVDPQKVDENQITFDITSIGQSKKKYEITAELVIMTDIEIVEEKPQNLVHEIIWVTRPGGEPLSLMKLSTVEVDIGYRDNHNQPLINLLLRGEDRLPLDLTNQEVMLITPGVLGNSTTTPEWQERGHIHLPILNTGETIVALRNKETLQVEELLTFLVIPGSEMDSELPELSPNTIDRASGITVEWASPRLRNIHYLGVI